MLLRLKGHYKVVQRESSAMKTLLKIGLPLFILGFIAGNAFWYLASPLWINVEVSESLPDELMVTTVATGTFRDADASHKGAGNAAILTTAGGTKLLRFTDFQVTNGPDLEVWLVAEADPQNSQAVKDSQWISLGSLKGNIGDQTYTIPEDTDLSAYGSVVIWCEQFGVLFSPASLAAVQ